MLNLCEWQANAQYQYGEAWREAVNKMWRDMRYPKFFNGNFSLLAVSPYILRCEKHNADHLTSTKSHLSSLIIFKFFHSFYASTSTVRPHIVTSSSQTPPKNQLQAYWYQKSNYSILFPSTHEFQSLEALANYQQAEQLAMLEFNQMRGLQTHRKKRVEKIAFVWDEIKSFLINIQFVCDLGQLHALLTESKGNFDRKFYFSLQVALLTHYFLIIFLRRRTGRKNWWFCINFWCA